MSLTTRPMRLHLRSVLGNPLPGAKVTLQLSAYQADGIEIVPLVWTLTEDPVVPGDYIGPIWPNTRVDEGTHYDLLVQANEQKLLTHIVTVAEGGTEAVLNLRINPPPYPPVYGAQAATSTANTFADAAGTSATIAAQYAAGLGDVSQAVADAQAAAEQAAAAEEQRLAYEDRVYPGVYSTPPSNKPHSGDPSAEGDRCVILVGGVPTEHLRSGGGWLIPNFDAQQLAQAATLPMMAFSALEAQSIFDNALPKQGYTDLLAYTGRATGIRITTPGIAGLFRYNAALPNVTNGASRFAHASGIGAWERLEDRLTLKMFGAAMDGVTDDVVAIEKACESGLPLDWEDGRYRVSRMVGSGAKTLTKIDWVSRGASVVLDAGAAQQQAVIFYTVAAAVVHSIRGSGLTFDASSKANIGCWFQQTVNSRAGAFYGEGLGGINCRRSSAFTLGNGVLVRGGFKRVDLIRPVARNILMPAGTGTPGVTGVQGIGVLRGGVGESYPEYTYIENPLVEEVRSEDVAYVSDQDGIAVFGAIDAPGAGYSRFDIVGGTITNAWGRSIKGQTKYGTVRGTHLVYTSGPTGGVGAGVMVDFQTGPGRVTDLDVSLDGVSTLGIVAFQTPVNGSWSAGTWAGGYVVAINGAIVGQLVSNYGRQSTFGSFGVEDVTMNGMLVYIGNVLTPDNKTTFIARRVQVSNLTGALARVISGGSAGVAPYAANVIAENCTNQGALVPLVVSNVAGNSATSTIDQRGCVGFGPDSVRISSGDASKSGLQQVAGLVGNYVSGGVLRPYAAVVGAGAEYEFPAHGYQNSVFMAMVSMAHSVGTQGIVWVGATAVAGAVGANVGVGASAEPATGLLRVWKGATGLRVKNNDVSSRVVTVFFFG